MVFLCWLPGCRRLPSWWSSASVCRRSSPRPPRRRTGSPSSACWRSSWSRALPERFDCRSCGSCCYQTDLRSAVAETGLARARGHTSPAQPHTRTGGLGGARVTSHQHHQHHNLQHRHLTAQVSCELQSQRKIRRVHRVRIPWEVLQELPGVARSCHG